LGNQVNIVVKILVLRKQEEVKNTENTVYVQEQNSIKNNIRVRCQRNIYNFKYKEVSFIFRDVLFNTDCLHTE
jgi:hypothetical protein